MKFLQRLKDRKTAIVLMSIAISLDLITTYLLLNFFPKHAVEINSAINFLIKHLGAGVTLFVVMPPIYALGLSIIYRLWKIALFRWLGYIVLIPRAAVVCWHFYLFYILLKL